MGRRETEQFLLGCMYTSIIVGMNNPCFHSIGSESYELASYTVAFDPVAPDSSSIHTTWPGTGPSSVQEGNSWGCMHFYGIFDKV